MGTAIKLLCCVVFCGYFVAEAFGQWSFSPEETEVFDLVDETKLNFYEFLGISQDATSAEVRRSYRKLSLVMHPDKNKTEGAEENFRILAAMYEVLKNKEKREIYNQVLIDGLPAAYRYVPRQLRKMGMLEASIIIAFIATLGHYLFMWGMYAEKRLTLDENLPRIQKRMKKLKKKGIDETSLPDTEEFIVPKPSFYDVLPLLLARKSYGFALWMPAYIKSAREEKKRLLEKEESARREKEEAERQYQEDLARRNEQKRLKQERNRQKREEMEKAKKMTSEAGPLPPSVFEDASTIDEIEAMYDEMTEEDFIKKKPKKDEWTEEDQSQLVKLMAKYPGGTSERWSKIAKEIGRSINEVTNRAQTSRIDVGSKAKYSAVTPLSNKVTVKNRNAAKIPDDIISTPLENGGVDGKAEKENKQFPDPADEVPSKLRRKQELRNIKRSLQSSASKTAEEEASKDTDKTPSSVNEGEAFDKDKWEQNQQKLFEMALLQFPKSSAERWEKIAKCVPGKTKEECIARYRFLAEKIQQRKKHRT